MATSLYSKKSTGNQAERGFTLAELLIVVAIIAVLTAIAIPVFTAQLERSREATDLSNIRSAMAEAVTDFLANGAEDMTDAVVLDIRQRAPGWLIEDGSPVLQTRTNGTEQDVPLPDNLMRGDAAIVVVYASGDVHVFPVEGSGIDDSVNVPNGSGGEGSSSGGGSSSGENSSSGEPFIGTLPSIVLSQELKDTAIPIEGVVRIGNGPNSSVRICLKGETLYTGNASTDVVYSTGSTYYMTDSHVWFIWSESERKWEQTGLS